MRNIICVLLTSAIFNSGFASSVDYQKLPWAIQEELANLWLTYSLYESGNLKGIQSIKEWNAYHENIEKFDALFEAATLDEDQKAIVGYLVYGNRAEVIERVLDHALDEKCSYGKNYLEMNEKERKKYKEQLEKDGGALEKIKNDNAKVYSLYEKYKTHLTKRR